MRCVRFAGRPRMRSVSGGALVILSFAWFASAQSLPPHPPRPAAVIAPPLSPRNANYRIDARLNSDTKTIDGREVITWRNITTTAATELQFHLYWNAWRNTRSTWLREAALAGRTFEKVRQEDWGSIDVLAVSLVSGPTDAQPIADLTPLKHLVSPDDGNPEDGTVLAVPLPQPVPPGGTVSVQVQW